MTVAMLYAIQRATVTIAKFMPIVDRNTSKLRLAKHERRKPRWKLDAASGEIFHTSDASQDLSGCFANDEILGWQLTVERLSREDHTSINQFVATAAESLPAMAMNCRLSDLSTMCQNCTGCDAGNFAGTRRRPF